MRWVKGAAITSVFVVSASMSAMYLLGKSILLNEADCNASVLVQYADTSGTLPTRASTHFNATLDICIFSYTANQEDGTKRDIWQDVASGGIIAEHEYGAPDSPDLCVFRGAEIDCAVLDKKGTELMTQ